MAGVSIQMRVKMKNKMDSVARAVEDESSDIVSDMMDMVQDKARQSMVGSAGGRTYVRHGIPHEASRPYRPPGIEPPGFSRTAGQLFASIATVKTGEYAGMVFTAVEYAGYLEEGTLHMRPRPFMAPAARQTRTEMNALAPAKYRVRIARAAV